MWKNILKAPITIGTTKIGLKPIPEDEDCCETARKEWIHYLIHDLHSKSFSVNDMVNDIKRISCEDLYGFLTFFATQRLDDFGSLGVKEATEIKDKWDKCEGK